MDTIDPGHSTLAEHDYGPLTIRARRVWTPRHDSLTLIAYHGEQLVATVIATHNGQRLSARIHQLYLAGLLFTRHGDWDFIARTRTRTRTGDQQRRLTLTASRAHGWRLHLTGEDTTVWPTLDAAAAHIAAYPPTA